MPQFVLQAPWVYVSSTAGILRRLVQSLGPAYLDAELQTDAWSFADVDMPGEVGWFRGPQEIGASEVLISTET